LAIGDSYCGVRVIDNMNDKHGKRVRRDLSFGRSHPTFSPNGRLIASVKDDGYEIVLEPVYKQY